MTKNWAEQEAEKLRGKICCCNDPQSDEAIAQALRAAYEKGLEKMAWAEMEGYDRGRKEGFPAAREAERIAMLCGHQAGTEILKDLIPQISEILDSVLEGGYEQAKKNAISIAKTEEALCRRQKAPSDVLVGQLGASSRIAAAIENMVLIRSIKTEKNKFNKSVAAFIASGEVQKMEWLAFVRGFEAGKSAALKVLRGHCATENCDEYDFCTDRAVMRTAIKALTPEGK